MTNAVGEFIQALGKENVIQGNGLTDYYEHIWSMDRPLEVKCLLLPRNTEHVSAIMRICSAFEQNVVPFGGKTNLVGSTECEENDVVISFEKMNKVLELDAESRTISVEAGVILEQIQMESERLELLFPLNFGAKGSAQIGGVISTNAGGMRVLRYGMTRNLVLGLEVVLPDGTVVNSMKKIIKDNSAYDVKQLFIGAEGTLGLITKAVLRLHEKPKSRVCAFVGINKYSDVVKFLKHMDKGLAGMLSAFELIWRDSFEIMQSVDEVPKVLHLDYTYYVLVESLGGDLDRDREHFESLLESALKQAFIEDAVLANSSSENNAFFRIREDVHVLKQKCKFDQHFDISLPIPSIGETIDAITFDLKNVNGVEEVFAFGHVADGNIHFMIGKENSSKELKKEIDHVVYAPLKKLGGSVSAEHGIGLHKKDYLNLCRTKQEIELMRMVKNRLDPKNLLNRGKVLS
ncbi:MAG: FAD-binding oxidoreductase [Bacteroidota bacterium]